MAKKVATALDSIKLYKDMLNLRRFEEKAGQLYTLGEISGFCHLYIGQEAVAVGIAETIEVPRDSVITSYRDHGIMIALGADPKGVMAELTGRYSGCSKGKGGSMHMFDTAKGFYGGHGIVGAQISIGTGLAFAKSYKESDGVSIAMMGDGAVNQGQVYESFNMAKLWNLPVIYIIENNGYAMGTSVARGCGELDLADRGASFGIRGEKVDGMDVFKVIKAMEDALARIRDGGGPQILEMVTYRYRGHSMSDPAQYRSKDEVEEYKRRDPILILEKHILDNKLANKDELKLFDKEIKANAKEVAEFALSGELPPKEELYQDIYVS